MARWQAEDDFRAGARGFRIGSVLRMSDATGREGWEALIVRANWEARFLGRREACGD